MALRQPQYNIFDRDSGRGLCDGAGQATVFRCNTFAAPCFPVWSHDSHFPYTSTLSRLGCCVGIDLFEVSELAFAIRAMRRAVEQCRSLPVAFLSAFSVPRSKHPHPSDVLSAS